MDDLCDLVAIPSVSSSSFDQEQLVASAKFVASLCERLGADPEILRAPMEDGELGRPAVVAHFEGPAEAPRVLLYAHHDVQPPGDAAQWTQDDPFTAVRRGERLYGRGTADDGAGVITHIAALETLKKELGSLPCSVTVFIEGEEEVGSPSFVNFLETYRDKLDADVIVVADSSNWCVGTPALTTSLRGVVQADVTLSMLDHALHSGQYGGPVMDAPTAMCRLVASLHDENGDVAVKGLVSRDAADVTYEESQFRADAGVLDGVELIGTGDLAARLWTKPTITLIGMDVTSVAMSSNTLNPTCKARLSMRIAPGQNPAEAFDLLSTHLREHAPFGAQLDITNGELGPAFDSSADTPAGRDAMASLSEAWQTPAVTIGQGGSIPFISDLQRVFPEAQVLVTGIEDPDTRAHSADESMHLGEFERIILAETLLLARLGGELSE